MNVPDSRTPRSRASLGRRQRRGRGARMSRLEPCSITGARRPCGRADRGRHPPGDLCAIDRIRCGWRGREAARGRADCRVVGCHGAEHGHSTWGSSRDSSAAARGSALKARDELDARTAPAGGGRLWSAAEQARADVQNGAPEALPSSPAPAGACDAPRLDVRLDYGPWRATVGGSCRSRPDLPALTARVFRKPQVPRVRCVGCGGA